MLHGPERSKIFFSGLVVARGGAQMEFFLELQCTSRTIFASLASGHEPVYIHHIYMAYERQRIAFSPKRVPGLNYFPI